MKTCILCKQTKPITEFTKHRQKKDGLSSWCKICSRQKAKEKNSKAKYKKAKAEYDKKRYLQNKEQVKTRSKIHYQKNKEFSKARILQWQQDNPDKVTYYKKNNKHKRREIISKSSITVKQLKEWENSQYKICSYCYKDCSNSYHIDHIVPLSKNGTHSLDNLTIACPNCNSQKSDTQLIIWYAKKLNT